MTGQINVKQKDNYFFKKVVLLNFIFCVFVVLIHAESPMRYGLEVEDYPLIWLMILFCRCAVPSFYFMSGMLFYKACTAISIKNKIKKRFKTLVVPYILWNLIFLFLFYIMTRIPSIGSRMNMESFELDVKTVLFSVLNSQYSPLWFVKNLIIYTILSPLIFCIIRRRWMGILLLIIATVSTFVFKFEYMNPLWGFPVYTQGALLGYWFYSKDRNLESDAITRFIPKNLWYANIGIMCAWFVCIYMAMYVNYDYMTLYRYCMPIIIWVLTDLLLNGFISNRFEIQNWMKCTFFIYCTHYFVLNIMHKLLTRTFEPTAIAIYAISFITPIITIFILIYTAKKARNNKVYKILTGGR